MSDAAVQFHELENGERNRNWTKDRTPMPAGREQAFSFQCPKHNRRCGDMVIAGRTSLKRDGNNQNGGVAQWDWNGDRDAPTFTPSVNCKGCWHGYIRAGRCVTTSNVDEPTP